MLALTKAARRVLQDQLSRQRRKKSPYFTVEGLRACTEAVTRRPEWVTFVVLAEGVSLSAALPEVPVYGVSTEDLASLCDTDSPQGVILVCRRPEPTLPSTLDDPFVLLLDQVRDPGNVGTILRSAWAVGLHHVFWTVGTADPWGTKTIRAGMGAQFVLNPIRFDTAADALDAAKSRGFNTLWQATPHGGENCFSDEFQLRGSVLSIGNETVDTRNLAGNRVCIPMPGGAESLNVAQAATLLLFEAVRRN